MVGPQGPPRDVPLLEVPPRGGSRGAGGIAGGLRDLQSQGVDEGRFGVALVFAAAVAAAVATGQGGEGQVAERWV